MTLTASSTFSQLWGSHCCTNPSTGQACRVTLTGGFRATACLPAGMYLLDRHHVAGRCSHREAQVFHRMRQAQKYSTVRDVVTA